MPYFKSKISHSRPRLGATGPKKLIPGQKDNTFAPEYTDPGRIRLAAGLDHPGKDQVSAIRGHKMPVPGLPVSALT